MNYNRFVNALEIIFHCNCKSLFSFLGRIYLIHLVRYGNTCTCIVNSLSSRQITVDSDSHDSECRKRQNLVDYSLCEEDMDCDT